MYKNHNLILYLKNSKYELFFNILIIHGKIILLKSIKNQNSRRY